MRLNLLIEILDFIKDEIRTKQLREKNELLITVLKKISGDPDKDYTDELDDARNVLIKSHNEAEPRNWTYSKYRLFLELDKNGTIGKRAVNNLNRIFISNQANPAGIIKEMKKVIDNVNDILKIDTASLNVLLSASGNSSFMNGKSLLTLYFEGRTVVNSINDIERYARIWNNIINDFAGLTMQKNCDPAVESIDKTSMILSLADGDRILESLSFGTTKVIETYNKILRIRKLQLEIIRMSLNSDLIRKLEEEITLTINEISHSVVTELMELNRWNGQDERDNVFNNVQKSLKLILDFIEKGGKIECQLSEDKIEISDRNTMLLDAYDIVGKIEETVKEIKLSKSVPEELKNLN